MFTTKSIIEVNESDVKSNSWWFLLDEVVSDHYISSVWGNG